MRPTRNGPILIPAFAVGRTQELLYMIRELEEAEAHSDTARGRRFADGRGGDAGLQPLARRTRRGIRSDLGRAVHPLRTHSMMTASSRARIENLNPSKGARIIISRLGHDDRRPRAAPRVRMVPDENATMIFVGYQAAGTTGRRIQDGEREVRIMKQLVPVRCRMESIGGFRRTPIRARCCAGWPGCRMRSASCEVGEVRRGFRPPWQHPRWSDTLWVDPEALAQRAIEVFGSEGRAAPRPRSVSPS